MKTILLISPEPWAAHTVSKHHYARTLAEMGHIVYYLEPPSTSGRLSFRPVSERLSIVSGPKVAPGLRFYPSAVRRLLERSWLKHLESSIGTTVDVVWLFENSRFYDMRFAGKRLRIYHQVDLNQDFHPVVAARTADICFCTTSIIEKTLCRQNRLVYKIDHGLAMENRNVKVSSECIDRFISDSVNAVYIGNLNMAYLDNQILSTVVRANPAVSFHLVGGYDEETTMRKLLSSSPNVRWWGRLGSPSIPWILQQADVLLVTYQSKHWRDQANPHKLMEYLASGKVVVATYTDEYRDKRHLLEMVDSNEEFPERFAHVVQHLDVYNSAERQAERRAHAADNTYHRQIERIFDHIRRELPGRI